MTRHQTPMLTRTPKRRRTGRNHSPTGGDPERPSGGPMPAEPRPITTLDEEAGEGTRTLLRHSSEIPTPDWIALVRRAWEGGPSPATPLPRFRTPGRDRCEALVPRRLTRAGKEFDEAGRFLPFFERLYVHCLDHARRERTQPQRLLPIRCAGASIPLQPPPLLRREAWGFPQQERDPLAARMRLHSLSDSGFSTRLTLRTERASGC